LKPHTIILGVLDLVSNYYVINYKLV